MHILAALFIDDIDIRQVEGPSTRIDLGGVQFSAAAPTPLPLTWAPPVSYTHLTLPTTPYV